MDTDAWLQRIGIARPASNDFDALHTLQWAHMRSVPFENLDVYLGRPLALSPTALFDKVVHRRRGGYCFELNTLFAAMLRTLGFRLKPHLARVWLRDPVGIPARNHLAHTVEIDGRRVLTDVGFGGRAPRRPLHIDDPAPVDDGDGPVRVITMPEFGYVVERFYDEAWQRQYSFLLEPAYDADIRVANHFTATHPSSHFTQGRFVGRFTDVGRNGLVDRQFTVRRGASNDVRELVDDAAWLSCLETLFGLRLKMTPDERQRLLA